MHGRCKEGARDRDRTADGQGRIFGERNQHYADTQENSERHQQNE